MFRDEGDLRAALQEHMAQCWDVSVPVSGVRLRFYEDGAVDVDAGSQGVFTIDSSGEERITRLRRQLCQRLSNRLSVDLFWREVSSAHVRQVLADELLQRLSKEQWLLRLKGQGLGSLRAILSSMYHPIDHQTVLDHAVYAIVMHQDGGFSFENGELVDDGSEMRLHFLVEPFEVDVVDDRIPQLWEARIEVSNNEVGEGAVYMELYLAPAGSNVGMRFAGRSLVVHRTTKDIQRRFLEAVQSVPRDMRGMMAALQEFAGFQVRHPEAVLQALAEGGHIDPLPDYAVEAAKAAFEAVSGYSGVHLIWALLEAPKYAKRDNGMPYTTQLKLQRVAAWLARRAGREWLERLPQPVAVATAIAFVS